MATHYVDSNASGANDGSSWADAWTSLEDSEGVAAGDTVLVDDGHSETLPTTTSYIEYTNGTSENPIKVLCVDKSDDSLSTGAIIATEPTSGSTRLSGNVFVYGLTVNHERSLTLGGFSRDHCRFESCTFNSTYGFDSDSYVATIGSNRYGGFVSFLNCTFTTSASNNKPPRFKCDSHVVNCTFSAAANHNFYVGGYESGRRLLFEGCDFTNASKLFEFRDGADERDKADITISQCTLASSWSLPTIHPNSHILVTNSDDGTITDPPLGLNAYADRYGEIEATLSVYRTGGADDGEQANAYAWKMAANSYAEEVFLPLRSPPVAVWTDPKGSISGATGRGLFTSTRMAPQGTPSALTTDSSSTWNGSGVGTKQKISHAMENGSTLTCYVASGGTLNDDDFWIEIMEPDQVGGPMLVRFCLAKPSTTVYVDPKLEVA